MSDQIQERICLPGNLFPVGFCEQCCERLTKGSLSEVIVVSPGRELVHAYCEHNQAGAIIVLRMGFAERWSITVPIDVIDWRHLVELKAVHLAAWLGKTRPLAAAVQDTRETNETRH